MPEKLEAFSRAFSHCWEQLDRAPVQFSPRRRAHTQLGYLARYCLVFHTNTLNKDKAPAASGYTSSTGETHLSGAVFLWV